MFKINQTVKDLRGNIGKVMEQQGTTVWVTFGSGAVACHSTKLVKA